jgi:hypothetical protein
MSDPVKGSKVPKKQHADKVEAVHPDMPEPALEATPIEAPVEPALTEAERAEATELVAREQPAPPPPRVLPRYRVVAGGRAWYRGQQIRFLTGDEFTAETWDPHAIEGFRACGVTIEQVA